MASASTQFERRLARVRRPRAPTAAWCQNLALFSLTLLILAIVMHRLGSLDTVPAFWVLGAVVLSALLAVGLGARAFYELWTRGAEGGLRAARGSLLALAVLAPFVYFAGVAFALPPLHDISTDLDSPPEFDAALDDRAAGMNAVADPTPLEAQAQLRTYPRVSARRYPLGQVRVFRAVVALITERDWTLLTTQVEQGAAPIDEEGSGLVASPMAGPDGRPLRPIVPTRRPRRVPAAAPPASDGVERPTPAIEVTQVSPIGRGGTAESSGADERYVEALATSTVFGFESDVVVRIIEEEDGTLVDMRSASRWGSHDLGANARRIEEFMRDLDFALQGAAGDG